MRNSLRAYVLPALFACLLLSGCSDAPNRHLTEMKKKLDVEIGTVEKASVLSADGQEIPIDLASFTQGLAEQGKDLQLSSDPIRREDVRYTLILYRKVEAPLVIEVGAQASQFANKTYRGSGAEKFYRWIREITGKSLFQADIRAVEAAAVDLARSVSLSQEDTAFVWQSLRAAEYVEAAESKQYPLYPHYRLKLDTGENVLAATVLTPTLLSVEVGEEKHYYRTDSSLFSRLTEWLPLQEASADSIDSLFKATEIRIVPGSDKNVRALERKIAASTVEQALSHEVIRQLKRAVPSPRDVKLPKQEKYSLVFTVNGTHKTIRIFERYFVMNGQPFSHQMLDQKILTMLYSLKK
jgi:hypothetical protein